MTNAQKEQVKTMRNKGESYAAIAEMLGAPLNTIKSYCLRNNLGNEAMTKALCEQCKKQMTYSNRSSRRFCSDICRMAWWHEHPKKLKQKAVYHFICPVCHKEFSVYGNAKRKYCSRKCYGKSKAVAK